MTDLLTPLYDLPDSERTLPEGVVVRRVLAPERRRLASWIADTFQEGWAAEFEVSCGTHPIAAWVATRDGTPVGFACHDGMALGFFGPTGVAEAERGRGIGEALLMATLKGMRERGYAYAIIGDVGPVDFYRRRLTIIDIPASTPGAYRDLLTD